MDEKGVYFILFLASVTFLVYGLIWPDFYLSGFATRYSPSAPSTSSGPVLTPNLNFQMVKVPLRLRDHDHYENVAIPLFDYNRGELKFVEIILKTQAQFNNLAEYTGPPPSPIDDLYAALRYPMATMHIFKPGAIDPLVFNTISGSSFFRTDDFLSGFDGQIDFRGASGQRKEDLGFAGHGTPGPVILTDPASLAWFTGTSNGETKILNAYNEADGMSGTLGGGMSSMSNAVMSQTTLVGGEIDIIYGYESSLPPLAAPSPPSNVAASTNLPYIHLSWSPSLDATHYAIYHKTPMSGNPPCDPSDFYTVVDSSTASYDDTRPRDATTFYSMRAIGLGGYSACTAFFSGTAIGPHGSPPLPPATLTATTNLPGRVDLSWAASSGATEYHIFRGTVSALGPHEPLQTIAAPQTTYSDTTAISGMNYYYLASARNIWNSDLSQPYSPEAMGRAA